MTEAIDLKSGMVFVKDGKLNQGTGVQPPQAWQGQHRHADEALRHSFRR